MGIRDRIGVDGRPKKFVVPTGYRLGGQPKAR
jgi:hypothetical protein